MARTLAGARRLRPSGIQRGRGGRPSARTRRASLRLPAAGGDAQRGTSPQALPLAPLKRVIVGDSASVPSWA